MWNLVFCSKFTQGISVNFTDLLPYGVEDYGDQLLPREDDSSSDPIDISSPLYSFYGSPESRIYVSIVYNYGKSWIKNSGTWKAEITKKEWNLNQVHVIYQSRDNHFQSKANFLCGVVNFTSFQSILSFCTMFSCPKHNHKSNLWMWYSWPSHVIVFK